MCAAGGEGSGYARYGYRINLYLFVWYQVSVLEETIAVAHAHAEANWADVLAAELSLVPPVVLDQIPGGRSNVTSLVRDADGRTVILRQPPDVPQAAARTQREARVLQALSAAGLPVPEVLYVSGIELPGFVMERIEGVTLDEQDLARLAQSDREEFLQQIVGLLAKLQAVDVADAGLGWMVKRDSYFRRQVRLWTGEWARVARRELPAMETVTRRLDDIADRYPDQNACVVHGDFRVGNMLVNSTMAPRINALLDWELTTVGHPLADLGYLGARVLAPPEVAGDGGEPLFRLGPDAFDRLTVAYTGATGRSLVGLPAFVALSAWRWAVILEGVARRFEDGKMGSATEDASWHRWRVEQLFAIAAEWLDRVETSIT